MMTQDQFTAKLDVIQQRSSSLGAVISDAVKQGTPLHDVESQIRDVLQGIGRAAVQLVVEATGDGDCGEHYRTPDGTVLQRSTEPKLREYLSIFGTIQISRYVYSERDGQKIQFVEVDARLGLPESKFSYLLQDWDQSLAVEQPFAQVSETIRKILGITQQVDSLERMNRFMAVDVETFHAQQSPPSADTEGQILVQTADGKGVPIRHPADAPPIESHQHDKGPKPDRKKMATVGAVYSVDPFVRTPEQVVRALFAENVGEDEPTVQRPRPQHKRMRAALDHLDVNGDEIHGMASIFGWIATEVGDRHRPAQPIVCIMDGQPSLWAALETFQADVEMVEILDLLHVTPRLWDAAGLFHERQSAEALKFVRERLLTILQGNVEAVIRGLRRMGSLRGLSRSKRAQLEKVCNYFGQNCDRMRYDEYLAAGYPIASGVIEGACRHVVKDRMERTGMNWIVAGAQSMLDMRCIHLCGDWENFTRFRQKSETTRLYPYRDQLSPAKFHFDLAL